MSVEYFLKFDPSAGIKGESVADRHAGDIEVASWSFGASNSASFSTGAGGGSGKVSLSDLSIMKRYDAASVSLFLACAGGKHLPSATLTARKAGGGQADFLTITLSDVIITSVQDSASSEAPSESISIAFGRISFSYSMQDAKGALTPGATGGWDITKNTKI